MANQKPFAVGERVHCAVRTCPFYADYGAITAIYPPGDPATASDPYWHDKTKILVAWDREGPANVFIPADLRHA